MLNKFIPIIIAAVSLIAWEAVIAVPQRFWGSLVAFVIIFFFGFLQLHGFRIASKTFWLLAAPPFFAALSTGVLSLFLTLPWLSHLLIAAAAIFVYLYLSHVYLFLFAITRYRPLSLERFSSYGSVASFTSVAIAAYGFINFLNTQIWCAVLAVAAVTFLLSYQFFWVNKIDEQHTLFAGLLAATLIVEFFWAISFFPVTHFISGLSLGIIYYVIVNLTLLHFLDTLEKRLITVYLAIGGSCVLLILLSARWL